MRTEIEDLREHLERYRAVTLQALGLISDEQLGWRPSPEYYGHYAALLCNAASARARADVQARQELGRF